MSKPIRLQTFQIGTPVRHGEGLRIAVTRRPPRGVAKVDWKRIGRFDVWLPALAPSPELVAKLQSTGPEEASVRKTILDKYEKELMGSAESRQTVALIAEIAARMPVSIGCFCANESHCHRSRLYAVIMGLANQEL
ncbi:MAG: DUF488 family protein [Terracidiphilus sp.]|nr:DUF488 family protein [Terracidiphilus sp.]